MLVKFKLDRDSTEQSINIKELPSDMSAMTKAFDPATIYHHAIGSMTVKIQSTLRSHHKQLNDGKKSKLPTDWIAFLKPRVAKTKVDRVKDIIPDLTDVERLALIEALKAK